jgi:peptide/nickel transport system substrate-binding protein
MKVKTGLVAQRITMMVMAVGLVLSAQVLVTGSTPAGAASGSKYGNLTTGYALSSGINPIEFDPVQFTTSACCFSYSWPIYAGLLRETTSGTYVPDLASAATVVNPTTLDITIRPGVEYSNGTPLDAAAVKAGFERNLTNPHPGVWDQSMSEISSIDVTGTDSLVMTFSQPVASTFYPLLADQESFMALPTGSGSANPNENLVGAGPFMLKSYAQGQSIVLVKNPKYWDASAIHLTGITFVNVPQGPQELNALKSGLVDVQGIPDSDIPALKAQTNLQSSSAFPDASYFFVPICTASGPLASLKVRQALNFATNRVAINNALLYGKGEPAWSIFPSTSSFYDKALTNVYAYNPKKAKALLAQAGYPHGFSTSIMPLPEPQDDQLATVLQQEWKQIGVTLSIVQSSNYVVDFYTKKLAKLGLNPEGLPGIQKITTQYISGDVGDTCGYNSPTLDALTKALEALPPSSPKLKSVWTKIQLFVIHNALSIYVDYAPEVTGAQKNVKNVQNIPYVGGVLNYWGVSVPG